MGRGAHHGNPPLLPALPPAADTRALAALAAGGPLLDWSHAASKLSVLLGGEPPVEEAAPPPTDPILLAVAAAKRKSKFRPTDPNSRAHPGTRDVLRVFSFAHLPLGRHGLAVLAGGVGHHARHGGGAAALDA